MSGEVGTAWGQWRKAWLGRQGTMAMGGGTSRLGGRTPLLTAEMPRTEEGKVGQGAGLPCSHLQLEESSGEGLLRAGGGGGERRGQELGLDCGARGDTWTPQWKCPQMPERKQGPGRWNTEPQPQGHPHSGRTGAERRGRGPTSPSLPLLLSSTLLLGCYLGGVLLGAPANQTVPS